MVKRNVFSRVLRAGCCLLCCKLANTIMRLTHELAVCPYALAKSFIAVRKSLYRLSPTPSHCLYFFFVAVGAGYEKTVAVLLPIRP